jgi:hypothetical protein
LGGMQFMVDKNVEQTSDKIQRLIEIGAIFESMGINTVEDAMKLKEHLEGCPGGKKCIENIVFK